MTANGETANIVNPALLSRLTWTIQCIPEHSILNLIDPMTHKIAVIIHSDDAQL
jgi:hypothetical protein